MDAKIASADMANRLMVWAEIGRPNEREWLPQKWDYANDDGLYPSGYYLFEAEPSASLRSAIQQNEKLRLAAAVNPPQPTTSAAMDPPSYEGRLWKGWVLPASEADDWFVAGSAQYRRVLRSSDVEEALNAQRAIMRGLELSPDTPMSHLRREQTRGVLFLDSLRRKMGDEAFLKLMNDYFEANTTKPVTAESFLEKAGVRIEPVDPPAGPAYLTSDIWRRLSSAVIVYGTLREAGANRYAAEQMQNHFLDHYESEVPIYKDFEASEELLRHRDVVFVGRPEANSALALWAGKLQLDYEGAAFKIDGKIHAGEREALILAAENPLDAAHMVLVVAGNDALSTVKAQSAQLPADEYVIFRTGGELTKGFIAQSSRR
jgi:hypothetical protein